MEVLARKADAAETIRAVGAIDAAEEVRGPHAALAGVAMAALEELARSAAMGARGAALRIDAVMAALQRLRAPAERAIDAALAGSALDAALVSGEALVRLEDLAELRLELGSVHDRFTKSGPPGSAGPACR